LLSIPVERYEKRRAETRAHFRHPMFPESARATWNGAGHDVELINVCGGGALIAGEFEPALWDRLELGLPDRSAECTVVWIKQNRIGLEFANTLPQ
jgi:hypothetical protein